MLIFTSGTSGDPKAVQLAHVMVLFAGLSLADTATSSPPDDVCYLSMPLFHSNAVLAGWAVAIACGAAMVPAQFSASRFLDDIRRYGATYMNYVGKPLAYVLATPEQPDDADNPLRVAFGNEASDRDIDEFARRFDCTVWDGFGSTENAVIVTREDGTPAGSIGKGYPGRRDLRLRDRHRVRGRAVFDEHGALVNGDEAVGELVNTAGRGLLRRLLQRPAAPPTSGCATACTGPATSPTATPTAGSTSPAAPPTGCGSTARTSPRPRSSGSCSGCPRSTRSRCTPVPDERVGDQVMAAIVLQDGGDLAPTEFEEFLAAQPDLSPKAWPRYVRIADDLPSTATNKVLKRELAAQGATAGDGVLWTREERGTTYA